MVAVNKLPDLRAVQHGVVLGQCAKLHKLVVFNVVTVFFSKQVLKHSPLAGLGQNDRAVHVVV